MADNFSDSAENGLALFIFNKTTYAELAMTDGTGKDNLYISLHTANPGEGGTVVTSECTATGYVRKAMARTSGVWTVSAGSASNAALVSFAAITAGTETATYAGLSTVASGAGAIIASAPLTTNLALGVGVTPTIQIGGVTFEIK